MRGRMTSDEQKRKDELERAISIELKALKGLNKAQKETKNKDILTMISYYNRLTEAVEVRRNQVHFHTLQLLAVSVGGVGILLAQIGAIQGHWGNIVVAFALMPFVFLFGWFIVLSLISIAKYENQNGFKYPFLPLGSFGSNKWKWFYYGNPPILKINTRAFRPSNDFDRTLEPYMAGLSNFIRNYREETLDREIVDNIQQLYLLQVHNYYKNKWYLSLVSLRRYFIYGVPGILIGFLVVYLLNLQFGFVK